MIRAAFGFFAAFMVLSLAGCDQQSSGLAQSLTFGLSSAASSACADPAQQQGSSNVFFAAPLCDRYPVYDVTPANGQPQNPALLISYSMTAAEADADASGQWEAQWISNAVADSEKKCGNFIGRFTAFQAGTNASLDIYSLLLSGLASVFTPVNTVRALAAASTAFQGVKGTLNTDVYQQLTMLLLVQEITATYDADMSKAFGIGSFPSNSELAGKTYLEFATLQRIHRECSLPYAASALSQTPKQNTPQPQSKIDVTKLAAGAVDTYKGITGAIYTVTASTSTPATYSMSTVKNSKISTQTKLSATDVNNALNNDGAQPVQ